MSLRPWADETARLRALPPYRRLSEAAAGQRRAQLLRTPVPLAAWIVEALRRDLERSLLVVVPRESEALAWIEAARLVTTDDPWGVPAYLPSPSLTPYHETGRSLQSRALEAAALDTVLGHRCPALVCTPRALFQPLPTTASFRSRVLEIVAEQEISIERLVAHLEATGYRREDLVAETGAYAVRGGVVDLFPCGEEAPVRLDFFGETVESLRRFDPATQRSAEELETVRLLPLSPFAADEERAMALAERLEAELGPGLPAEVRQRLDSLLRGEGFPGWENLLPVLEPSQSATQLLDRPLVVVVEPETLAGEAAHFRELLAAEYRNRSEHGHLALPPELLTLGPAAVEEVIEQGLLRLGGSPVGEVELEVDFEATETDRFHGQLPRLPRDVETARARGERCWIVAPEESHGRMREYLDGDPVLRTVEVVPGELSRGFQSPLLALALYGEEQLFARRTARPRARRSAPFLSGLRDLRVGEFVVHEDHGIGRYVGMRALGQEERPETAPPSLRSESETAGLASEVMEIEYADGRTLLLPLSRIHQIQRYSGIEGAAPRLDRLGGASWTKKKNRVKRSLRKLATDLLKLYAERQIAAAPAMAPDSDLQRQFEAAFEHEETEDQLEAAVVIKTDLEGEKPMDRLLCGDVGFGKTEVAMRAAFKVVDSGHQVAVLAPTTILADQHLDTFRERFSGFPVRIEMISRFRSAAEIREVRERAARGEVDVLIGTHRLLGRDLQIPRLGLVIIDEEQRFGVGQKEKLKELRKNVHVLAMSATPVPRTLQLSLAGVRDLSVIETPPRDRMAVETRILPFASDLVKEAIEFELERGGQVYFVYNRVEGIEEIAAWLRELVPQVRVTVGHGQMDEQELSRRMHAFTRGEYDLLLATTIIENGIDIPNVNTMLVHRADRFGLAQLYQLRGRVGRSDQRAFCYLLVPSDQTLPELARKRLQAIRDFSDLGAGFRIAARDLEIRGAGNLLGAEQSGHIAEIGIETYLKMLEDTVRELRGEAPVEVPSATIDLPLVMTIPSEYIPETNLRMEIYRRMAEGDERVGEIVAELRDRFGPPPESVETLAQAAELKRLAESLRVQAIAAKAGTLTIRLRRDALVDVERLIRFVSERGEATFSPSGVLTLGGVPATQSLAVARQTLEVIAPGVTPPSGTEVVN